MSPLLKRFIFPTVSVVNKEDQKYVIYNFKLVTYGLYFKFWNKHSDVYVKYTIEVYGTVYYLHTVLLKFCYRLKWNSFFVPC